MKTTKFFQLLIAMLIAISFTACGGGGGGGGDSSASSDGGGSSGGGDTTPPTVSSTSPTFNATNVAINTSITATFSEAMAAPTINTATFTLSGGITGTVTYSGTTATFTPSSNLAGATTYTATITTGVTDSAGNAMAAPYTWTFTTPYPRFAYVANFTSSTISIYTVDSTTGQLRHNGYVAAGTSPISVTVDPSGKFAYAANLNSSNISVYTINQTTGALTAGTAVAAGTWPYSVTTTGTIQ